MLNSSTYMEETKALHKHRHFLSGWILFSILAIVAGMILSWYTARDGLFVARFMERLLAKIFPDQGVGALIISLPTYIVTTTDVGAVIGYCLSLGQWWVLRERVEWAREWLIAGLTGAALSYFLMAALNILAILIDPDPRLLKGIADSGFWMGGIMGLVQWQVLRQYDPKAYRWIFLSTILFGVGFTLNHIWGMQFTHILSRLLAIGLRRGLGIRAVTASSLFFWVQMGEWIIAGYIGGIISGKLMAWFLEKSDKTDSREL